MGFMRVIFLLLLTLGLGAQCQASLTVGCANAKAEFNNIAVTAEQLGNAFFAETARRNSGGIVDKGDFIQEPGSPKGVYFNNVLVDVGEIRTVKEVFDEIPGTKVEEVIIFGNKEQTKESRTEGANATVVSGIFIHFDELAAILPSLKEQGNLILWDGSQRHSLKSTSGSNKLIWQKGTMAQIDLNASRI
jgi:hypothetical protein